MYEFPILETFIFDDRRVCTIKMKKNEDWDCRKRVVIKLRQTKQSRKKVGFKSKKYILTWLYSKTLQIPISIINSSHLHNPIRTWKSKNVKSWSKIQLVGRIYPRIDLTSFFRGMSTFIKTNCIMKNEQKLGKTRVSESKSFEKFKFLFTVVLCDWPTGSKPKSR